MRPNAPQSPPFLREFREFLEGMCRGWETGANGSEFGARAEAGEDFFGALFEL